MDNQQFRSDWWLKSSAGLILGLILGFGLSGLFMLWGPEVITSVKVQFTMWLVAPVWLLVLAFVFMFRTGLQAWLWLGGANLVVFLVFFIVS
jgi:hypothetical protein